MEKFVTANIAIDLVSIILSAIPVIYLIFDKRYKQKINMFFLCVALSNVFMIIGDIVDWLLQNPTQEYQKAILSGFTALYYSASAFVLFFFAQYLAEYLKLSGKMRKISLYSVTAVCAVQVLFAVISPFTGSFFYVTDNGYQRGELFFISQLVPFFCYCLFTLLVILHRKVLKKREIVFFLLYIFVPLGGGAAQMFTRGIAVVNAGVAFALIFILVNIQMKNEIDLRDREKELTEQRVDIMLSQIQPHFLYNSLGTIAELCKIDPDKAEESTIEFARFLRGNMESLSKRSPIPFKKELNHVRNYLYLEQQRFGKRLSVVYDIEEDGFLIPPLSLQPLVENAVNHGILQKKEGGEIRITSKREGDNAVVKIIDNGIGIEKAKNNPNIGNHMHIGIENVRSRIEEMVKGNLKIESSDAGTTVTVCIPVTGDNCSEIFGGR